MKIKKSIFVAGLAITLTSIGSFTCESGDFNLDLKIARADQAYTESVVQNYELMEVTSDQAVNIYKFIVDKLRNKEDYKNFLTDLGENPEQSLIKFLPSEDGLGESLGDKLIQDIDRLNKDEDEEGKEKSQEEKDSDKTLSSELEKVLAAIKLVEIKELGEESGPTKQVLVFAKDSQALYQEINAYVEEKRKEIESLKESLKSLVGKFTYLDKDSELENINKEDIGQLRVLLDNINVSLAKEDISIEELEGQKSKLDEKISKISGDIKKKFVNFNEKLLANESKLKEEEIKDFKAYMADVDKHLQDFDLVSLNADISKLDEKNKELDKILRSKEENKLKEYKDIILSFKAIKDEPSYYRATSEKRKSYDQAIGNLENYIGKFDKDEKDFVKEKADELKKKVEEAKNKLDGDTYDEKLIEVKKKLDHKSEKISSKAYKSLTKEYKALVDNKKSTIDDINNLDKKIDQEKEKGKLVALGSQNQKDKKDKENTSSSIQVKKKKVAVPKSGKSDKKKAKSIVRTGIDSVKIFAILGVIAIILLLVTRKNKNKD